MDTKISKQNFFERYLFAGILLTGMFLAAQYTGHKEIVFPEIFAVITGCLIAAKTPWNISKIQIVILMTISALFGVITVKYIPIPIYWKILIGLFSAEMLLVIFKTNFVPIIPAVIFPVFMNVKSCVYPVAVLIMTTLIVLSERYFEKKQYRPENKYCPQIFNRITDLKRYLKAFIIFAIIAIAPIAGGMIFWLSPPVVAAFVELSAPESMNRKRPVQIWKVMFIASLIGTMFRYLLNIYIDLPLIVAGAFAITTYLIYCNKKNIFYPPASGALLMPLILKPVDVLWYPLEIALGLLVLIPISLYLFCSKTIKSNR